MILLLLLLLTQNSSADWFSEWLTPIQLQYKEDQLLNSQYALDLKENQKKVKDEFFDDTTKLTSELPVQFIPNDISMKTVKYKLEETLRSAKDLIKTLKKQIQDIETNERYLKEAIVQGKNGVTSLTITTTNRTPQNYLIRDGFWSICNGMMQSPITAQSSSNIFNEIFSIPRCIGEEIPTKRDPCVFNSVIKYETIPITRRATYEEDDYLCLKSNFNNTLEKYFSVPRQMVEDTCKRGTVKTISDNMNACGLRILSEYKYYPNRDEITPGWLEYCTEKDGSCNLIVAWHLSNSSIENFETLSEDKDFKKTFLKRSNLETALS